METLLIQINLKIMAKAKSEKVFQSSKFSSKSHSHSLFANDLLIQTISKDEEDEIFLCTEFSEGKMSELDCEIYCCHNYGLNAGGSTTTGGILK